MRYYFLCCFLFIIIVSACKNECKDVECINGSCDEGICECFPGYTGTQCETRICDTLECLNGGECMNGLCDCPEGFSGVNCEVNLACNGVTCQNGGTCNTATATCDCLPGYTGDFCETILTPTSVRILSAIVDDFPATNNGLGWDASDGPDIYLSINVGTTPDNTEFVTSITQDVTSPPFTITGNFPLEITDIESTRIFALYDSDTPDTDEYMEGVQFPLSDFLQAGFPTELRINPANLDYDVTLNVEWVF